MTKQVRSRSKQERARVSAASPMYSDDDYTGPVPSGIMDREIEASSSEIPRVATTACAIASASGWPESEHSDILRFRNLCGLSRHSAAKMYYCMCFDKMRQERHDYLYYYKSTTAIGQYAGRFFFLPFFLFLFFISPMAKRQNVCEPCRRGNSKLWITALSPTHVHIIFI